MENTRDSAGATSKRDVLPDRVRERKHFGKAENVRYQQDDENREQYFQDTTVAAGRQLVHVACYLVYLFVSQGSHARLGGICINPLTCISLRTSSRSRKVLIRSRSDWD